VGVTELQVSPIHGHCDAAFGAVEAAFRENFVSRDEVGAAVCVLVDGRVVVDLWGGHHDREQSRPWQRDTLVNAYSVGKGLTAMLVLGLVERGELDLDAPISGLWPAFAAEGKGEVTLRTLLSHRGGLPGVRGTLAPDAMFSWETMCDALAGQAPYWVPGTAHGYHVNTFGFLVGEPVCRRLGVDFASAFRECLAGPRGADFGFGLPRGDHRRVAPIVEASVMETRPLASGDRRELARRSFGVDDDEACALLADVYFNPSGLSGVGVVNTAPWRSASIPSTNGHGTARGVAALYDVFMRLDPKDGGIVGPGLREEATSTFSEGQDRVLGKPSRFGLGLQLSQPSRLVGGSDSAYGHFGYGGTLGFADPQSGVAFGYLMNRPGDRWQTPRTHALVEALYASLGERDGGTS